eukprot:2314875-Amphidinium_carterae.1
MAELGHAVNPIIVNDSMSKEDLDGLRSTTKPPGPVTLAKLAVTKVLTTERTTKALVLLSRMATLAYTRRHVLGSMAMPSGQ